MITPSDHAERGMRLLAESQPVAALAALGAAVALGADDPVTHLNLALAEAQSGDSLEAVRRLDRLAARLPDWDEPDLRRAELFRADGDRVAAENAYRRTLAKNPGRLEALVALGALLVERGESEEAKFLLKRCCALWPDCDQAWDALGLALLLTADHGLAEAAFHRARRLKPAQVDYALHCAEAALLDGRGEDALARLERESDRDPLNAAVLTARGEICARLGRRDVAIDLFEAAAALAPTEKLPATRLAMLLAHSLRQHEAEAAMRAALALDPDNTELGCALSVVLMRLQRHIQARALLLDLIGRIGEDAPLLCNLATVSVALGEQDAALDYAQRGIACAPGLAGTWRTLSNALPYCEGIGAAELLRVARMTGELLPRIATKPFLQSRDPARRVRIGLLSGTLKTHPVGWLTIAGFEALDRDEFAIICLHQQISDDAIAQRFAGIAAESHEICHHDDVSLAGLVRDLAIDILIDLGGHGDFGRMAICASRCAPVQVKWVGMQNASTGFPEMDWIIGDRWEIPESHEQFYSERPLRLADGYVCYSPPPNAPDVAGLPALSRGHVTFGCYNNLAKMTPSVLKAWAGIMMRVAGSRLILKTQQFHVAEIRDRVLALFADQGIAADRIELRGTSAHRALLAEYGDIDMVLDPFPYSGGLTTCEALWMGVPTVTFPGESFASRHSFSHLSNIGLTDWIADDLPGYQDLAVAKAGDVAALALLRAGLRERVKASPLCDARRFGKSLGDALRLTWQDWCRRDSEAHTE